MMKPTLKVERLVEIAATNPARSFCECGNLWLSEYHRELAEYDLQLKQSTQAMFDESPWYIKRVEVGPVWQPQITQNVMRDVRVEEYTVAQKDLPAWAKERGLKLSDLMDVLNLRVREVSAKGKRYQSNHPRQMFIDRQEPRVLVGQSLADSMPIMEY